MASVGKVKHTIPPLFNRESEILILGSFPSVKSREMQFFYGHPQNRFWRVLAAVLKENVPQTVSEKCDMLYKHHIALWDVIESCEITGSSDASIRNVVPNNIELILARADIRKICCNGGTSTALYRKFLQERTGMEAISLPSTSLANAKMTEAMLIEKWREVLL